MKSSRSSVSAALLCLVAAAVPAAVACSDFGSSETDDPVPAEGDAAGVDADFDALEDDVDAEVDDDAGQPECTTFESRFDKGDLRSNGFENPVGTVAVTDSPDRPGAFALVAHATLPPNAEVEAGAERLLDLPLAKTFASVDVSFDVYLPSSSPTESMTVGCELYARTTRDADADRNRAFLVVSADGVRLTVDGRLGPASTSDTTEPFAKPPQAAGWHEVVLSLTKTKGKLLATATFDGSTTTSKNIDGIGGDPRLVAVKCGLPHATDRGGSDVVELMSAVDDVTGRLCLRTVR